MAEAVTPTPAANAEKGFSPTGYPFTDFKDSLEIPALILNRGGGSADLDQIAAWLNYKSPNSGTFASRMAAARYFGLIGPARAGRVELTERSRLILAPVMPEEAVSAKAEAFLAVPLFKKLFDQLRGQQLPPDVGLKNLLVHTYKISNENAARVLRLFKDSASQTGFFESAPDRLIRPTAHGATSSAAAAAPAASANNHQPAEIAQALERRRLSGGGGDGTSVVHPAIVGLLRVLSEKGPTWTEADQKQFNDTFTGLVKLIYPAKGEAGGA
jgi:hypothetical protein